MGTVSAANAVLMLTINSLFPVPQQVQGFGPDDVFDIPTIKSVESLMGVDGVKSDGFVFTLIPQQITLQADSASNDIFDVWWTQMQAASDVYIASGIIRLPSIGQRYSLAQGSLTGYKPAPPAKRILQPRTFEITWGRFNPQPI